MTPNNNLNVLPLYESLEDQNHRKEYAFGNIFKLISGQRRFLPFQVSRPHDAGVGISSVILVDYHTGVETDVTTQATGTGGMKVMEFPAEGYDLIINQGALNFSSLVIDPGQYYIKVTSGAKTWYSEIFTACVDLSKMIKIEWFDEGWIEYSGGHIDYTYPYRNYCFISSDIGKPEYPFIEEAQDRDGHPFVEHQISEKKYRFEFPAPEFLCDALRVVRLHDEVRIYHKGRIYDVESIVLTPKWQEQGDIAIVEVEFECDTIVKKTAKGVTQTGLGDFNQDYNEDYYNI